MKLYRTRTKCCAFERPKKYFAIEVTAALNASSTLVCSLYSTTIRFKVCQNSCFFTTCASYASESSSPSGGRILHAVSLTHYYPIS
jgi:hypothetical protein